MSLHAFKRDGAWPWLANENMFCIVVHDAEGGYLTDLSVPSEDLAETVLALLNGRSVAPVSQPLPPGVTPNPQTFTLAAGATLGEDGWEYETYKGAWLPCRGKSFDVARTIRRVAVEPQPDTVEVPWAEAYVGGLPIAQWKGHAIRTTRRLDNGRIELTTAGLFNAITIPPSGMVTVLVEAGEAATSNAPTSAQADR